MHETTCSQENHFRLEIVLVVSHTRVRVGVGVIVVEDLKLPKDLRYFDFNRADSQSEVHVHFNLCFC